MRKSINVLPIAAGVAAMFFGTAAVAEPFDPDPFQHERSSANTVPAPPAPQVFRMGSGSYLGVNLREVDSERAKELKLREEAGVEITRVEEESPADKAGLKAGDVVLAYNGQRVEGMEQFSRFVRETPPGREVKLLISRDGNSHTLSAKLGTRKNAVAIAMPRIEVPMPPVAPSMPDLPRGLMMWRSSALGIEAEPLRGQMADFFGVKEGVLVRNVIKDSAAAKAGLKAGDVITKIEDTKVTTPSEVSAAVRSNREKKSLNITLIRERKEMTLTAAVDSERSDWPAPVQRVSRTVKM